MAQPTSSANSRPQSQNNYATNLRRKFGEIGNFWNRYDKLADNHDQRLIKNLNDNLDVLLIFAGLFSAVNTSFLQMTTPSLSPDPSAETNYLLRVLITKLDNATFPSVPEPPSQGKDPISVRANCLLYSSLCCSILAAVGAMLAKEWLQSFERGGQVGPIHEQVLRRQHKFNGVRQWLLEPMTRLLPTILLISVVLFFFGLIEFLIPLDHSATGVVMAFANLGIIYYILTTAAGAIWDACPYQTSVSKAIKYMFEEILILSVKQLAHWLMQCLGSHEPAKPWTAFVTTRRGEHDTEILRGQAACWLLETTSSPKDQKMAIQNLIRLTPGVCSSLIHDWAAYERVVSLTVQLIQTWQEKPNDETVLIAQQFSAALMHLWVGYTKQSTKWSKVKEQLVQMGIKPGEHHHGERLSGCLELCLSDSATTFPASPASIFPSNDYSMKVVTLSMIVLGDIPFWSLDRGQAWSALWHVFRDKYDDTVLALMALAISRGFPTPTSRTEEEVRGMVRNACSGQDIVAILLEGVRCGPTALLKEQRPAYIHALPIFTEIVQRLGELPSTRAFIGGHPECLFLDVARLILAVNDVYDTAPEASSVLDTFMDGALGLLRKFKPPVTNQDSAPIIFNGTLVSFVRCNQTGSSISTPAMQTLDWLNLCLSECDFVAEDTVSCMMWALKSTNSREQVLELFYTYASKRFLHVKKDICKLWVSKGLIGELLEALWSGATATGSMNLMVPMALRHVINRALSMSRELREPEEIMRIGIDVINSANDDTGTVGQAYSHLTFEVVLSIWRSMSEESREEQMSEKMVRATKRILLEIEELLGDQPGKTLTDALRSKIGTMVCSEAFTLSPDVLQKFLSELTVKKPEICAREGLGAIVDSVRGVLFNGAVPGTQV